LLLLTSSKVHPSSKVKVRRIWHFVNKLCDATGRLQKIPNSDGLRELHGRVLEAERRAYEDDAAADAAKTSLFEMQLSGMEEEGNSFSPLGRLLASVDIKKRLTRRLRLAEYLSSLPPSAFSKVPGVMLIVGLPRTGSTMISRLLASDPNSRSPKYWEFAHDDPDVSPAVDASSVDCRSPPVDAGFKALSIFSPNGLAEFFKFHKVGAEEHEEITGFSRRYFYDMETALLSPVRQRERLEWNRSADVDRSFLARHLKKWLQVQKLESEESFWILKSPAHTAWLEEHVAVFPAATVIFTSRSPSSVLPSIAGLNEVALSVKYDYRYGMGRIGEGVVARLLNYAVCQGEFCDKHECVQVRYDELLSDPIEQARRIYSAAGRELTDEIVSRMVAHKDGNKQGKHGKADYSMEKFELDRENTGKLFEEYEARFC
jgi:hypothetical protein